MTIDLSLLPKPSIVETLDFETEFQRKKALFKSLEPDWDADVESDPALKLLEVSAYDAINERQRVNDAAAAVFLLWSKGDDLDNAAVFFKKTRNTIFEATDSSDAVMESDADFLERILLSWSEVTNAGTKSSYKVHAKEASSLVKDAVGIRDEEGNISVYIMSYEEDGSVSDDLLSTVQAYFDQETVYQLCTTITVKPFEKIEYSITVKLSVNDSKLKESLKASAKTLLQAYFDKSYYLGTKVGLFAVYSAIDLEGIVDADVGTFTNVETQPYQAPYCTSLTII